MKLLNPVKEVFVTQYFGENPEFYLKNYGINAHNGIDYRAPHGTPVYATHDGFAYYEWDSAQGEGVVIRSKEMGEIDGKMTHYKTIYWHLVNSTQEPQYKSPIKVFDIYSQGQEVKAGDLIGYADNTGLTSSGSHLHFGLKPVSAGEDLGSLYNPQQNNGYAGAINPMPYLPMKYKFNKNLERGNRNAEVYELQTRLISMGYTIPDGPTTFYGAQTQAAVFRYQMINVPMNWWDRRYEGRYFGPKTRSALNNT